MTDRVPYCKCAFTDPDGTFVPGEACAIHPDVKPQREVRTSNERSLLKQTADLLREMREDIFQRGTLSGRSQRAGDDLLRRIDTILITPVETTRDETGWLIEVELGGRPHYWKANADARCIGEFDPDANAALRLSREKDARDLALFLSVKGTIALSDVRKIKITEHMWPSSPIEPRETSAVSTATVLKILQSYRCHRWQYEGTGAPMNLTDVLTPAGNATILIGISELESMADYIAGEIKAPGYCMCGKSQLAEGQRGYYCRGCGKDLHPDNYSPEEPSGPRWRHDWETLAGPSYRWRRCSTTCLDAHTALLCVVEPEKASARPVPDHLKAPVFAADKCPAVDDLHTEHKGKCMYCGAPMPPEKASADPGVSHPGCNYLAPTNGVCNKCGWSAENGNGL